MRTGQRILLPLLVLLVAVPAVAQTEEYNHVQFTSTCGAYSVQLHVEMDIVNELPAHWVGWVVDRTTIGACEPVAQVTGVIAFPVGPQTYNVSDSNAEPGQAYAYRIRAVDAEGNRYYLTMDDWFPPGYYMTTFSTCENAVAARGYLTSWGYPAGLAVCSGQCWYTIGFVSELPAELVPLIDQDAVVEFRADIADEFEGPYLINITGWSIRPDCGVVPAEPDSWGSLKARYR